MKLTALKTLMIVACLCPYFCMAVTMDVFTHEKFERDLYSDLTLAINNEFLDYERKIKNQDYTTTKIEFHNILPLNITRLELRSEVIGEYIYAGQYKSEIFVNIPNYIFKNNGIDSLIISLNNSKDFESYTIQQEVAYKTWEKDKTVHIYFLPFKKLDNASGTYYGYTIELE